MPHAALDHAGEFMAQPVKWHLQNSRTSGARGVWILWVIQRELTKGADPQPWRMPTEVSGTAWHIRADGSYNNRMIETLANVLNWNGDEEAFETDDEARKWKPGPARITVAEEEYNGVKRLKVQWINSLDSSPGGIAAEELQRYRERDGANLRALVEAARKGLPMDRVQLACHTEDHSLAPGLTDDQIPF